jgi:hypothetical protein
MVEIQIKSLYFSGEKTAKKNCLYIRKQNVGINQSFLVEGIQE